MSGAVALAGGGAAGGFCTAQPTVPVTITNSGHVMVEPKVHFIFWGNYWKAGDGLDAADRAVQSFVRVPEYFAGLSQYGVGRPKLAGMTTTALYEPPSTVSPGTVATLIESLMDARVIPNALESSRSIYYVVLLPPSVSAAPSVAFHDYIAYPLGIKTWFSFVVANPSTMMYYLFHELVEGMTDPEGAGVRVTSATTHTWASWEEISDACFSACGLSNTVNGVPVAAYWSQADGACVAPGFGHKTGPVAR